MREDKKIKKELKTFMKKYQISIFDMKRIQEILKLLNENQDKDDK